MFDLEQAIVDWRQRMLAAGITTPVPLEELEIHLRDEIEEQAQLGLGDEEAFNAAVHKMGEARPIQNEFKKVGKGKRILRSIMLIFGWLAASYVLAACMFSLDFNWNFFKFSPRWNREGIIEILGMFAAVVALWFLAKASRDKVSRAVSLLVSVLMAGCVIETFPAEKLAEPITLDPNADAMHELMRAMISRALDRHVPSPLWYRGGLSLLLCMPVIFWIWSARRRLARQRGA